MIATTPALPEEYPKNVIDTDKSCSSDFSHCCKNLEGEKS
jgi:hypothetical protein